MTTLTCHVTNDLNRPIVGMEVQLQYRTDNKALQGVEFESEILSSGLNSEWKAPGLPRLSLDAFMSQICPSHESKWYLIFRTGKHQAREETSWLMVPVFIYLQWTEPRIVRLTLSHNKYHVVTTVAPVLKIQVRYFILPLFASC